MTEPTAPRYARSWIIGAGILLLVLAALGVLARARGIGGSAGRSARELFTPDERAPDNVRIRVEILNATATPRLALSATRLLRDRGFDVVSIGNSPTRRDSTLVIDRTGHPEWSALVARIVGGAAVEVRPDTSRYVDVSVLLGADWTPPAKTLYP